MAGQMQCQSAGIFMAKACRPCAPSYMTERSLGRSTWVELSLTKDSSEVGHVIDKLALIVFEAFRGLRRMAT